MILAFVFPGQGSQSVGMMGGFESLPAVRRTFEEASSSLGWDLWTLVSSGPDEELNKTVNTQPAMLTAGVALFRAWQELGGVEPTLMAGHSLGEYSALVAAGVLELKDAVPLVRFRAQAMQEAVPEGEGAIAAILGLDDEAVLAVCREAADTGVAEAANFNSPGQVVIAGEATGVRRAIELAKARGAKRAVLLPMSVPSHCSLMRPAAERLSERLALMSLQPPRVRVINNADVAAEVAPERIRSALTRQLYSPVRWVESVTALVRAGVQEVVECGPGGVLATLCRRTAPDLKVTAPKDAAALEELAIKSRQ
jgi:[acyl-carrier-protein] S-malonyltransferase